MAYKNEGRILVEILLRGIVLILAFLYYRFEDPEAWLAQRPGDVQGDTVEYIPEEEEKDERFRDRRIDPLIHHVDETDYVHQMKPLE
ncbi:Oidioi.mRNA.OKI2018_I69.chr2.g5568.t1.cds [Oikopleura dioica]|uniref:Oidioi.mRNA.OKI2018_I69.chr2.g5568.t1.cds n=1 Tax=Oikopleura dioica TaxID=34765 RepID=A0ABN7T6D3_OIKDI|nr:Oidioi.mRNA.OKI2018_I69.chr2.g5568.t1.cds [Oikopleura dioica]